MLTAENIRTRCPDLASVEVYDMIDSTNARAVALARAEAPAPTLILAGGQTAGRGRGTRSFFSPAGVGIYLSLLLRPRIAAESLSLLTPLAAVATAEAIEAMTGTPVGIKWVNDLWIREKKICGILTEGAFRTDGSLAWAVIGIGVNVGPTAFPPEIARVAGSISDLTGTSPDRDELTLAILTSLCAHLAHFPAGVQLDGYRRRSILDGRDVTVSRGPETFTAHVLRIDEGGALRLRLASGEEISLSSGEIVHVSPLTAEP